MAGVIVHGDLIPDILAKLPVKSLLRFNCVCKTWYSIISDPQFSNNLHSMRRRPCVLISEQFRDFYTLTMESLLARDGKGITPLSLPWQTKSYDHMILGSCNGLVCLYYRSFVEELSGLVLWNPSTRKFKKLSCPPGLYSVLFERNSCTCVWFGYDELMQDYILVLLDCEGVYCPPIVAKLYVFTLKLNLWRRLPVDHIALGHITLFFQNYDSSHCHSIGVLSNGSIHWVKPGKRASSDDTEECILTLDLATEKFRLLKFSHHRTSKLYPWIRSLPGGCLCLCTYGYEGRSRRRVVNLWIMKEYGVESSWTKLLLMPISGYHFLQFYPILFSKEGKEIVAVFEVSHYQAKIVKLRVKGGKVRSEKNLLRFQKQYSENNVVLHMESLVSLN